MVVDINTTPFSSDPGHAVVLGAHFLFVASDRLHGGELWKTDGTAAGTSLLKDILAGAESSEPMELTAVGATVFFTAFREDTGRELWMTDGTAAGTSLLKDIQSGVNDSFPRSLTAVGNTLYFVADDGVNGSELWKTDGTPSGTVLVKNIMPDDAAFGPDSLTAVGNTLYFVSDDGVTGSELWRSDGTPAGTFLVKDIRPVNVLPGVIGDLSVPRITREFEPNNGVQSADDISGSFTATEPSGPMRASLTGTVDPANDLDFFRLRIRAGEALRIEMEGAATAQGTLSDPFLELRNAAGAMLASDDDSGLGMNALLDYTAPADGTITEVFVVARGFGSFTGTYRLTVSEVRTNPGSNPTNLVAVGSSLFFSAYDDTYGQELWKSDGTSAGTVLVKDIGPGLRSSVPSALTAFAGMLYFTADNGDTGAELWRSDGTAAGTELVKDIHPGSFGARISELTPSGNFLYFVADDGLIGRELWRTDGTASRTLPVRDVFPGGESAFPGGLFAAGNTLYFSADDGLHGREVWKTNGTGVGTVMLADLWPGLVEGWPGVAPDPSVPRVESESEFNGSIAFADDLRGSFVASGTPARLKATVRGAVDAAGDRDFFRIAVRPGGRIRLTAEGAGAGAGTLNDPYLEIRDANGRLLAADDDSGEGFDSTLVYSVPSDGSISEVFVVVEEVVDSATGTYQLRVAEEPLTFGSSPKFLGILGTNVLFSADDGTTGIELWKTDGTAVGTVIVKDIQPGTLGADPTLLGNAAGTVFFAANDFRSGRELWRTDSTSAGTRLVEDIRQGELGSDPRWLAASNGRAYFAADGFRDSELWVSDGTSAGTGSLGDVFLGPPNSSTADLTAVGDTVYFPAIDGVAGYELWKTDGTAAGTKLVKDIEPGSTGSAPGSFVSIGGTLYFVASTAATGTELWRSDGTAAGTTIISDLRPGNASSFPRALTVVGTTLYFVADNGLDGAELWKTNGTPAGTVRLKDILPGSSGSAPGFLTAVGNVVYFAADDGVTGRELWKTDGTPAGTVLVKDIRPAKPLPGAIGDSTVPPITMESEANDGIPTADDISGSFIVGGSAGELRARLTGSIDVAGDRDFYRVKIRRGERIRIEMEGSSTSQGTLGDPFLELRNSGGDVLASNDDGGTGTNAVIEYTAPLDGSLAEVFVVARGFVSGTGTYRLTVDEVFPNPGSEPGNLVAVGSALFFTASDGLRGQELWKTDGTAAGTVLVRDIRPGGESSNAANLTAVGRTLYFSADDGETGQELWKSDGTEGGTRLGLDIWPGQLGSHPSSLHRAGGSLYFAADDGIHGRELWSLDEPLAPEGRIAFGYGYDDVVYLPPEVVGRAISEIPVRIIGAVDSDTVSLSDFVLERDGVVIPWAAVPTAEFPQEPTFFFWGQSASIGGISHLTADRGDYTIRFTGGATDVSGNPLAEASFSWNHAEPVSFGSGGDGWAMLLESDSLGLYASDQAVDAAGVTYVVGSLWDAVDFDPRPEVEAIMTPEGQGETGFIARYDVAGSLLGVWQIGGAISQVAVANGRLAIAGTFLGAGVDLDPRPGVVAASGTDGEQSGFVVTLNPTTGAPVATTIIAVDPAAGWDQSNVYGYGISLLDLLLADDGRAFVSGSLQSATITIPGAGGTTVSLGVPLEASDGFVAAIDAAGAARWATRFDGRSTRYDPATAGSMALAGDVLALGVARSGPLGILPDDPETAEGAVVIALDASAGGYRWHATVTESANDSDTVFVAATPDGRVHAAGATWVGDFPSGSLVASLITVTAATGSTVGSVRSVGDLIGAAGDVYVAGLLPRADGSTLLVAKEYGAAGGGSSLHMANLAPWSEGGDPAVETWSTPQEGWSGAVSLAADGRVVFLTSVYESDLFPIGQDGGSEQLVSASGSSIAIWSVVDPFATVVDPPITVPAGETRTDMTVHSGDEQVVKRGAGTLVLDLANSHSGGTVVEEGTVVVRNTAALGLGTLDVRAGATVRLDVGFGTVALPRLTLAAGAILDLGEARVTIGPGGADEATIRQWIIAARGNGTWNGTSGITSRAAAAASGSRTIGYVVRPDGSATVTFTAVGDLDLDRDVDVFDLLAMSTGGRYGSSSAASWTQGDVNYDGRAAVFDLVGINTGGSYGRGSIVTTGTSLAVVQPTGVVADPAMPEAQAASSDDQVVAAAASVATPTATAVSPAARTSAFARLAAGIAWESVAGTGSAERPATPKKQPR